MRYPFFPFKLDHNGDDGIKVMSPYPEDNITINPSAARLLMLCNGSRAMDEIAAELCSRFQTTEKKIKKTASRFIEDFADRGLIWLRDEKMRWFDAPAPQSIFWEITAECNLKCLHCVVSADKKLQGELSTQQGLALIHEWRQMGVQDITFSGGEPMMRRDFFELAHAAAKQNFILGLATNGTLITPSIASELKKLKFNIQVSLDGSNAEIYGKFRGKKRCFDLALEGIETLLSAGHDITIGTVISRHNVDDIPAMLDLVEDYGIKYFRLIPFIAFGRGQKNSGLELEPEKVKAISAHLVEERKNRPFEIVDLEFEHTFKAPPTNRIDPSQPSECGGAIHYCTVTPEGDVLPCHYFEGVHSENVKQKSFRTIWRESRFLNYFRSLRIRDINGYCRQCEWLSICRGGCKAANFSHRSLFHANRHCWVVSENKNRDQRVDSSSNVK